MRSALWVKLSLRGKMKSRPGAGLPTNMRLNHQGRQSVYFRLRLIWLFGQIGAGLPEQRNSQGTNSLLRTRQRRGFDRALPPWNREWQYIFFFVPVSLPQ